MRTAREFRGIDPAGVAYRDAAQGAPETRIAGTKSAPLIRGYAAVFDAPTTLYPGYREVIRRGAFAEAVERDDVAALFNHDPNFLLARTSSGTLRLWEDEVGLGFEIDPPRTRTVEDMVLEPMRRKDLRGASFGFVVRSDRETPQADGTVLREILEAELYDVSPVTYPAYAAASSGLAARAAAWHGLQHGRAGGAELVALLRSQGLTADRIRALFVEGVEAMAPKASPKRLEQFKARAVARGR